MELHLINTGNSPAVSQKIFKMVYHEITDSYGFGAAALIYFFHHMPRLFIAILYRPMDQVQIHVSGFKPFKAFFKCL